MTHLEAIQEFHRAGAFALIGNLLSYSIGKLIGSTQRTRELRACAVQHSRLERIERAHICDGCGSRGAGEHAWFCPDTGALFNSHVGVRRAS